MEIKLTEKESEEYFCNALCNGGLQSLECSGIELEINKDDYKEAKKALQDKNNDERVMICYEDVLMQILRGGKKLKFVDVEDEESEQTKEISLADVHEKVCKMPIEHLNDYIEENDDATTADVLLQTVLYGEIIFG